MTGSPDAIPLVKAMADYLGEPLTVHMLERYVPIEAAAHPMSLADTEPGTAPDAWPEGHGERYRATIIGPGVLPDIYWESAALTQYDQAFDLEMHELRMTLDL